MWVGNLVIEDQRRQTVGGHRELRHQSLEGGGRGEMEEEGDRRCEGV